VTETPGDDPAATAHDDRAEVAEATSEDSGRPSRRPQRLAAAAVIIGPVAANLFAILNLVKYQPEARTSALGFVTKVGFLSGGQPFIDPNVGYNSYAVGHAAALSWLHGHVPWWNFNEGIGAPLAGSIQSASFFPPTLLLALTNGSLWYHFSLELMAGVATYALLRQLRCSPFAAAVGALAFELCGSLAWLTNAPANAVPFLPMGILGVEWILNAVGSRRRGGWILLALSVWLSLVAGFPEVAVFSGGLTAVWLVVRLLQRRHDALRVVARTALAGLVGALLAAPLLNAFVRALQTANIGSHTGKLASLTIPRPGLAMLLEPYVFGGIFDNADPTMNQVWSRVGGYTGVALFVLAVGAVFGRKERWPRFALFGWALLFLGSDFGVPVLHQIVQNIPGLTHIAVFRYATSSVLFALCVLAAMCLDDLKGLRNVQILVRMLPGVVLALGTFLIGFFASPAGRAWAHHNLPKWYWGSIAIFAGTLLVLTVGVLLGSLLSRRRSGGQLVRLVLGGLVLIETFGFFEVPILAFPREVHYDTSAVAYLRAHLGSERFYTLGPISPNWGSFYGIAEFDLADLPIPKNWANYVHSRLNPCEFPWQFGNGPPTPSCPLLPAREMLTYVQNYEASGVKYVVTGSAVRLGAYFQPRINPGTPTPNGAARMVLQLTPPAFYPTAMAAGFDLRLDGGVPPGLTVKACTPTLCALATPVAPGRLGWSFRFPAPIELQGSLTITLSASATSPVVILTAPVRPGYVSTVTADGTLLAGRTAMLTFLYEPSSIPKLVKRTTAAGIYQLPHTTPVVTAPSCKVTVKAISTFSVDCRRASALTYRELAGSGWTATVGGHAAKITTELGVFQRVLVPRGTSEVSFTYLPPDTTLAWIGALLGLLVIVGSLVLRRVDLSRYLGQRETVLIASTRRPRHAPSSSATPATTTVEAAPLVGTTGESE
jgi:hypothetical protein